MIWRRHRRDEDGLWSEQPSHDVSIDGAVLDVEPDPPRRPWGHWLSVVINFGLIGALALAAWFWSGP